MKSGGELLEAFTNWVQDGPVFKDFLDRREYTREHPEIENRAPFFNYEHSSWKVSKEGMNKGFDAVFSSVRNSGVEYVMPVEVKSNSDSLDHRLMEQIQRHITVFGQSCVVIDSKLGESLLSMKKGLSYFIPAIVFVYKGREFVRVSSGPKGSELPKFYTTNLHNLLPYGLKGRSEELLPIFSSLNSIMRKLYMERARAGLSYGNFEAVEFTTDELRVMEGLIVDSAIDGTIKSFQEAVKVLKKIDRRISKTGDK